MFGSDAQGLIDDRFGGALNVAFVLEPLAVAHVGAETEKKSAASQWGIIAEKLASNRNSGTAMGIAHLIEFFLNAHNESKSKRKPQSRAR